MGIFDDIRKTVNYAKRNGISAAFDAAVERLSLNRTQYAYEEPDREMLKRQQGEYSRAVFEAGKNPSHPRPVTFSILTPLYLTDHEQLAQMIESVKRQTWGGWELILTDASPVRQRLGTVVDKVARDGRIFYYELPRNDGIADNTNVALKHANGEYIILLDHDDLLTPDALYEMARAIASCGFEQSKQAAGVPSKALQPAQMTSTLTYRCMLAYSDEDKFADDGGRGRRFFEPHHKPDFDFDRLLTNNYICHLTAVRADIAKRLQFRRAYDGAQDYDLFLRTCAGAVYRQETTDSKLSAPPFGTSKQGAPYRASQELRAYIAHVPKVLYHWRSHALSTASNPASKTYAYDAGQKALEDFAGTYFNGNVKVEPMRHLGFYHILYEENLFHTRPDVGVVGGKVTDENGTLIGGRMDEAGTVFYEGLKRGQSGGYQHAAVLAQEADAVDLRNMTISPALEPLFRAHLANANNNIRNIITLVNGKVIIGDFVTPEQARTAVGNSFSDKSNQTDDEATGSASAAGVADGQTSDADLEARFAHLDNSLERVAPEADRSGFYRTPKRPSFETATGSETPPSGTPQRGIPLRGGRIDISVGAGEDSISFLDPKKRGPLPGIPSGKKAVLKSPVQTADTGAGVHAGAGVLVNKVRTGEADVHDGSAEIPLAVIDPEALKQLSLAFCKAVREKGYRIVWDPQK